MGAIHNTHKWKKATKRFREEKLFCEVWLALGRHVLCEATDHIIRIEDGGAIWLEENWMAMSHFWHNRKNTLEQNGLSLDYIEKPGGKVPLNRQQIVKILAERFKRDIQEWQDGLRT